MICTVGEKWTRWTRLRLVGGDDGIGSGDGGDGGVREVLGGRRFEGLLVVRMQRRLEIEIAGGGAVEEMREESTSVSKMWWSE